MKGHMNVPIFIPHLGCPHDCVFCNQRSITNTLAAPSAESVAVFIEECLVNTDGREAEIAFFGGSFTGIDKKAQEAYLKAAAPFVESGRACGIRISTRPDTIDADTLSFLKAHHVKHIELGAQSMSDEVLAKCGRGHTAKDTERASALIRESGFVLGLQMMVGLPNSTPQTEADTARAFVRLGAEEARIYPTVVFEDTALYHMMQSGAYTPISLEDAVSSSAEALAILEAGGVTVLRVGLQETETLGAAIRGGAYHPAMGELVRARLWRNRIASKIGDRKEITITCPPHLWSQVVGQKRENIAYFKETCGVTITMEAGEQVIIGGTL